MQEENKEQEKLTVKVRLCSCTELTQKSNIQNMSFGVGIQLTINCSSVERYVTELRCVRSNSGECVRKVIPENDRSTLICMHLLTILREITVKQGMK